MSSPCSVLGPFFATFCFLLLPIYFVSIVTLTFHCGFLGAEDNVAAAAPPFCAPFVKARPFGVATQSAKSPAMDSKDNDLPPGLQQDALAHAFAADRVG